MKTCQPLQTTRGGAQPAEPAPRFILPDVNIAEAKDGWMLQAEMPGVSKEGLELTLEGNELAIVGRRASAPTGLNPLFRESSGLDYRRVFELDPSIDSGHISAHIEQGLLTVELPKAERVKPRKIEVTG